MLSLEEQERQSKFTSNNDLIQDPLKEYNDRDRNDINLSIVDPK